MIKLSTKVFSFVAAILFSVFSYQQSSLQAHLRTSDVLQGVQLATAVARFPLTVLTTNQHGKVKTKKAIVLSLMRSLNSLINQGIVLYKYSSESWSACAYPLYDFWNVMQNCQDFSLNSNEILREQLEVKDISGDSNTQENTKKLLTLTCAFLETISSIYIGLKNEVGFDHQQKRIYAQILLSATQSMQAILKSIQEECYGFQTIATSSIVLMNFICMLKDFIEAQSFDGKVPFPVVKNFKWGEIIVKECDGSCVTYEQKMKDCVLTPEKSQEWDWKKTNMHHKPGIQIADVQPFIDNADIFILSRGVDLVLQVPQATVDFLQQKGKVVHVLQSEKAVQEHNRLVLAGKRVVTFLHSTC